MVAWKIAKRARISKEFSDLTIDNISACLKVGASKKKRKVSWCPLTIKVLKFNVDGAARGKLELAGIDGVLRMTK